MKRAFIFAALLSLAACHAGPVQSPGNVADSTALDEQIGITATNAYTAASKLGTALAASGVIDKAQFKAADQKGYEAVQALHTAYLAGNSTNYVAAASNAYAAAAQITALIK